MRLKVLQDEVPILIYFLEISRAQNFGGHDVISALSIA
jgi:hypothetical protein